MPRQEFKTQTLRNQDQWNSCVHIALRIGTKGIELFGAPAFEGFLPIETATDVSVSDQGELFGTLQRDGMWWLTRSDPNSSRFDVVLSLSSHGVSDPSRLWWTKRHLWVLDRTSGRILGFTLGTFQVTREIQVAGRLIDADVLQDRSKETIYALVELNGTFQINVYPAPPGQVSVVTSPLMRQPAAIAAAKDGRIVVFDAVLERFLRLENGQISCLGDHSQGELRDFTPVAMEIGPGGAIYLASNPNQLKLFDPDGSYLTAVKLPSQIKLIRGMGFDATGGFYIAADDGVAVFALSKVPVGVDGTIYPPVLDNGKKEGTWHGVSLMARLPAKCAVEVAYYAFNDEGLKQQYTQIVESSASAQSKDARIDSLLKPLWRNDTGQFTGDTTEAEQEQKHKRQDMLFVANRGRYLCLRVRLKAYDASSHPSISEIQVSYPRLSLLRYLPAAYQEDPVSAAFLERFLALFETVFQAVDADITNLHRYFDPATTPADFLSWLACWLRLSFDDDLSEQRKRRLIANAPSLFRTKGTPEGIRKFLNLYTGVPVSVREPSLLANPFAAGQVRLGEDSYLARRPNGALRIGENTVLGEASLVVKNTAPSSALSLVANRFDILLDMDPIQYKAREPAIRQAIRDSVPAHARWTLRLADSGFVMGSASLEDGKRLRSSRPFYVGLTPLGLGQVLGNCNDSDTPAPRLEHGAAFTPNWRLLE